MTAVHIFACVCVCVSETRSNAPRYLWACCQTKMLFDWPLSLPAAPPPFVRLHCNNLVFIEMAINLSLSNFNDFASLILPFESKRNTNTFSLWNFYAPHHSLCVCLAASHLPAISSWHSLALPAYITPSSPPPSPFLYLSSFLSHLISFFFFSMYLMYNNVCRYHGWDSIP